MLTTDMHLGGDITRLIRSLRIAAVAMPDAPFRDGFLHALSAVEEGLTGTDLPEVAVIDLVPRLTGWEEFGPGNYGAFQ